MHIFWRLLLLGCVIGVSRACFGNPSATDYDYEEYYEHEHDDEPMEDAVPSDCPADFATLAKEIVEKYPSDPTLAATQIRTQAETKFQGRYQAIVSRDCDFAYVNYYVDDTCLVDTVVGSGKNQAHLLAWRIK